MSNTVPHEFVKLEALANCGDENFELRFSSDEATTIVNRLHELTEQAKLGALVEECLRKCNFLTIDGGCLGFYFANSAKTSPIYGKTAVEALENLLERVTKS